MPGKYFWMTGRTAAAMLFCLTIGLSGCSSEQPLSAEAFVDASVADDVPTLAQITAAVSLDDGQIPTVRTALAGWRSDAMAASETRYDEPGFEHAGHGNGLAFGFVADVAPVLNNATLGTMVGFLTRHQLQAGERRAQGEFEGHGRRRGRRGGRGGGGELGDALGLTDEQKAAIRAARETMRASMKALREQFINDEITEDELHAQAAALRAAMQATIATILTPEQLAQLEAMMLERFIRRLEHRIEKMPDGIARRVDRMARILELTEDQIGQITTIYEETIPSMQSILDGVKDGSTTPEDGHSGLRQIRSDARDAVMALLTEEQLERLSALHPMVPKRRR